MTTPNKETTEITFAKIPVTRPVSSPLSDMLYKCHVVEQLKEFMMNEKTASRRNLDFLENLKDVMHRIANTIGMKTNKNDVFKSGGLKNLCILFNQFASFTYEELTTESVKQPHWKAVEEIISDMSYILYKMAEHTKARTVMITTGVIYAMWSVAQRFNTILDSFFTENNLTDQSRPIAKFYKLRSEANQQIESAIYHMNEIVELLSSELSLSSDFSDLFKSANRHLFSDISEDLDSFGLHSCDIFLGVVDLPLTEWTQESFNMFLESNASVNLSISDFDLNLHNIVINGRTHEFLDRYFVKWNVEKSDNPNTGFFLLKRDQGIEKFVLQKFCQLLYTDSLVFTQSDVHYLKTDWENEVNKKRESGEDISDMVFSVDKKFERGGIKILLESLKNENTRSCIQRLLNLGEFEVLETDSSLFDEFDEKLLKQEFEFFFKENVERDTVSFFHHKKDQIKENARHTGGLEEDFTKIFISITSFNECSNDFDVLLSTEKNELGQVDMEVMNDEKYVVQSSSLIGAQERGGISCHRCILSARSEYMRKIFKYETSPKCLAKCEDLRLTSDMELFNTEVKTIEIPNLSYSTLSLIIRFIYCGENILKIAAKEEKVEDYQLIPQTYVECLIASDLFLLYPLKKFCEQQIMAQLDSMKEVDQDFASMLLNIALTYNCGEVFREKCGSYLR